MTTHNHLKDAKSPYLLQHADNPVHWYEWSEEAFARAKKEDKPVLLSVGYAACHWVVSCHVGRKIRAHESFEDEEVARFMNESFVSVKIDREERPDIDRVYMTYLQATSGRGGWPATYFLTPELCPIFAGTYFPKHTFISLLTRVSGLWAQEDKRQKIRENGGDVMKQLAAATSQRSDRSSLVQAEEHLEQIYKHWESDYDGTYGGFGQEPKFPSPALTFYPLNRIAAWHHDQKISQQATEMVRETIISIEKGGIHDHVGHGIARYSVDEKWLLPHFEKMLYDQAQLLSASLEAALLAKDPDKRLQLEKFAVGIVTYLERDLQNKSHASGGGFFCAEDADSLPSKDETIKKEGAFYVWTFAELSRILGNDVKLFGTHFGIKKSGNVPEKHDIQGELEGQNVLAEQASIGETANRFGVNPEDTRKIIDSCLDKLKAYRDEHRPRPHLDDKILTAWNGLAISALSKATDHAFLPASAGRDLSPRVELLQNINERCLTMAKNAVEFIRANLWDDETKILHRSFREGKGPQGQADDYAFLIAGLLDLFETDNCRNEEFLKFAEVLQQRMDELFYDEQDGGYFASPVGDPYVLIRLKEFQEGAEPTAMSIAVSNLYRLARYLDDKSEDYSTKARSIVDNAQRILGRAPFALGTLASNALLDPDERDMKEIVVTGSENDPHFHDLLRTVRSVFVPNRILHVVSLEHPPLYLASRNEALKGVLERVGSDRPAVQICENKVCGLPVTSVEAVTELLEARD